MTEVANLLIKEMQEKGLKYLDVIEEQEHTIVSVGFNLSSASVKIHVFCENDNNNVAIRCFGFLKVNESQFPKALLCCNELNQKMRWVKFYIGDEGEINIEDDAIVDNVTAGSELLQLVMRMASIADDAYPIINRAIWS